MHKIRALAAALTLVLGSAVAADTTDRRPPPVLLYVASDGNDKWSGGEATPNTARTDGPFATVQRARDAVRDIKRRQDGKLSRPIVIRLRGGSYELTEPLVLTPDDSGSAECPVTYEAAPNETPLLSGGRRIRGWKEVTIDGKQLWAAELPEARAGKWYFHQLWVNGQRRTRARHPNDGFLRIAALPDAKPKAPLPQGQNRFEFAPGDLKAWHNLQDVEVVALHLWVGVRLPIAAVDEGRRLVTFAAKSRRRLMDGPEPARYYVENAFELLDSPGEWYLNRQTGVLYYMPQANEKLAEAEVVAPVLTQLLRFEARPEANQCVRHLTFRRLGFAHADWWLPRDLAGDVQAAADVPAAIQGDGVCDCAFEACSVAHVSAYGIHLARGCQNNAIADCELFDLGAGGLKVGETGVRDSPADQTHGNRLTGNHIHDGGHVFHQAVGVWIGQSHGNRVAHNHIHDLYYTGISAGWTWGYGKSGARDNVIEFNHVHDLGKEWLSDMGGVYTLGVQPGTVIRSNVFHDIAGYRYGGWGIYFDEGSTHILAENNLVYRTKHAGFHQHYGKENVVRNNVFALGREAQLQRSRPEPHLSFTFEHNLVYWKTGELLAGKWAEGNVALDYNLYWRPGGEVRFGKLGFKEWQEKGYDRHSVVADPLFVDPDKADFHLQPDSPASRIGFKPLERLP